MQGYPILNLFLLANLMTTTSTLPVLLGLLDGPIARRLFTPLSALFGCWFSFACIVAYGRIMLSSWGGSMSDVSSLLLVHLESIKPCMLASVRRLSAALCCQSRLAPCHIYTTLPTSLSAHAAAH